VTLVSSTSGASIHYTLDGTEPTIASTPYAGPIVVDTSLTIKAIAVKTGMMASSVQSADYLVSSGPTGSTVPWNRSISYGTLTDSRDGAVYRTVVIGAQTWMAENLNHAVEGSWWYRNSADSGTKYGRLYTWSASMDLPDLCNSTSCANQVQSSHRGICPAGWHMPSDSEWTMLSDHIGDSAAKKLKSSTGWLQASGTDPYGFRALPASLRYPSGDGSFGYAGYAYFWSSTEYDEGSAWYRSMDWDVNSLFRGFGLYQKTNGFSVRCLKDGP